jgi:hypothetical protein
MKHIYITIMTCFVVFFLTSCSDSSATPHPDLLIVKRLDPLHQSDTVFEKSIQNKADVKRLYEKILSLPPLPQGTIHCPDDNGVEYELTFTLASKTVSKAMVSATGCQGMTMNDKTYWAMEPKGNGFRALLEHALGLNDDEFRVGFASRS